MRTQLSVDIDRPIEEVFERTLNNVSEWSITCVEDEVLEETPEGVGTRFRIVTLDRGQRMEFDGVVVEHEEPKKSRIHLTNKSMELDVLYTFEDLGSGTRVTQSSHARGKGFLKVVLLMAGWMMKKSTCNAQQDELNALKAYCESPPAAA